MPPHGRVKRIFGDEAQEASVVIDVPRVDVGLRAWKPASAVKVRLAPRYAGAMQQSRGPDDVFKNPPPSEIESPLSGVFFSVGETVF